jgi:endonuclease/exonuclease/phosphatase family metal-dependent hydrolase
MIGMIRISASIPRPAVAGVLFCIGSALACLSNAAPQSPHAAPTCATDLTSGVRWVRASPARERDALDRWCAGVGGPARIEARQAAEVFTGSFAVVSWNTHVGAGNIDALAADLRSGRLTGRPMTQFVLLLQEAYRAGADVPSARGLRAAWASAQRPAHASGTREDIIRIAQRLGLHLIYVPSMRNGAPGATDEDRGNAILSTIPLTDARAIELPLENQRRVAIEAAVTATAADGRPVQIRLVSTHFTNMVLHHIYLLSESGRLRQARALADALPKEGALVVAGDFNSWFGYRDAAYKELAKIARPAAAEDRRATFGPLRLDHALFRLPAGWQTALKRAGHRYGSDHYPLVATIDIR